MSLREAAFVCYCVRVSVSVLTCEGLVRVRNKLFINFGVILIVKD